MAYFTILLILLFLRKRGGQREGDKEKGRREEDRRGAR
jgi:hypothetical protein